VTIHDMTVATTIPMLEALAQWLDKGAAHPKAAMLIEARLAPDMFTLAQQVQQACQYALDGVSRLAGKGPHAMPVLEAGFDGLKAQIARTLEALRAIAPASLDGSRDCSIEIPGNMVIAFDGETFLRAWMLPHFFFHVVTAYDILRHNGVELGKRDYLSQVGAYVRPKK
jgi:hypothetical protein